MGIVELGIGLAAAVTAIVGGVAGGLAGKSAAQAKAGLMRQQAQFGVQQSAAQLHSTETQQAQQLGAGIAQAGASGFAGGTGKTSSSGGAPGSVTPSISAYLAKFAQEQRAQDVWSAYATAKTAGFQETAADITEATGNAQLFSSTLQGFSSGLSQTAGAVQNWYRNQSAGFGAG
jgi:hypothetical protein